MVNTLLVYFSKFGNTMKVTEAIADVLGSAGNVSVIPSSQLTIDELQAVDLVVMGTPTHKMNLPAEVRPIFDALPKRILKKTPVVAFDTSYKLSAWLRPFTAARRLLPKLRKLGGKPLLPPQTFHVMEREGPLYEGEIERAREWARQILARLRGEIA
jgi:flavodoxin